MELSEVSIDACNQQEGCEGFERARCLLVNVLYVWIDRVIGNIQSEFQISMSNELDIS